MTEAPGAGEADIVVAAGLLDKLRAFAEGLDEGERRALAALLAPGVAAAWADQPEVVGYSWSPDTIPSHLGAAVRAHHLRIEGWSGADGEGHPSPPR